MPFKAVQFGWWALHLVLLCNSLSQVEGDSDYESPGYDSQTDDTQTDDTQMDVNSPMEDTQTAVYPPMDGTPANMYDSMMNVNYGGSNPDIEDYPGGTPEAVSV